jgi:hypothetical protein
MVSTVNGLEYNSSRAELTISEHGRHVQKLIKHAKTIADKEERQAFIEEVIDLMHQMNPQNKNVQEYRLRLWRHMYRIADYDIDVTAPEGVSSTEQGIEEQKVDLPYPQKEFRFRHYGNTIQLMVAKAIAMEDEEMKQEFTEVIAAYMKLAYRTWNREHYVNDEIIKNDLVKISKGKLELPEEFKIGNIGGSLTKSPMNTKSSKGRSNGKGRSNSNVKNRNKSGKGNSNNNNNNNRMRKRK